MNIMIVKGHLTRDPELRHTTSNTPVANGCVATNRRVPKDGDWEDEATFIEFTVWGKRAEAFVKYHSKGSEVLLTGRSTNESWTDRATGKERTKLRMTAEEWEFVGPKTRQENQATSYEDTDTPF